jgi:hypothetical protein
MVHRRVTHIAAVMVGILGSLPVSVLGDEPTSNHQGAIPRKELEEILWWLPVDVELVGMSAQPFVFEPLARIGNTDGGGANSIKTYPGPFKEDRFNQILAGHRVVARAAGYRRFRPPKGLGMMRREGCSIWRFAESLGSDGKFLMSSILHDAARREVVEACHVAIFATTYEQDTWHEYIALPRPDILLIAEDAKSLREVLQRMKRKNDRRAVPPELPEWRYLDPNAQEWVLRHYDRTAWADVGQESQQVDWTSPFVKGAIGIYDPDAIGLAYSSPRDAVARVYYLSTSKDSLGIAERSWHRETYGSMDCQVRLLDPGTVEISHPYNTMESKQEFAFALGVHLGFGVRL